MKYDSIAMIETNGLVSSIAGLEAILKLDDIVFIKREVITNGQVTVFVSGNTSQLKRAILAGEIAVKSVGKVISSVIIENPSQTILDIILHKKESAPKHVNKKKKIVKQNKVDTLFDDIFDDPILEESIKRNSASSPILQETEVEIVDENISKKDEVETVVVEAPEIVIQDEAEQEPTEKEIEEKVASELSHIERLKAEAKLEIEREKNIPTQEDKKIEQNISAKSSKNEDSVNNNTKYPELGELNELNSDIEKMNVPQLRKLAREKLDFPIKGREISRANRQQLLSCFNQLKNV